MTASDHAPQLTRLPVVTIKERPAEVETDADLTASIVSICDACPEWDLPARVLEKIRRLRHDDVIDEGRWRKAPGLGEQQAHAMMRIEQAFDGLDILLTQLESAMACGRDPQQGEGMSEELQHAMLRAARRLSTVAQEPLKTMKRGC